jgi:hypothetical protein
MNEHIQYNSIHLTAALTETEEAIEAEFMEFWSNSYEVV